MTRHETLPVPTSPEENHDGERVLQAFSQNNEQIIDALMADKRTNIEQRTTVYIPDARSVPRYLTDRFYEDCPSDTFDAPLAIELTTRQTAEGESYTRIDAAVDVEEPRLMDGDFFTILVKDRAEYTRLGGYETSDGYGNHATMSEEECRKILLQFAIENGQSSENDIKKRTLVMNALPVPEIISLLHEEYQHSPSASFGASLEDVSLEMTSRLTYDYNAQYDALQLETIDNQTNEGLRVIFRTVQKYYKPVDSELAKPDPFPMTDQTDDNSFDSFITVEKFTDDDSAKEIDAQSAPRYVSASELDERDLARIQEAADALGIGHLLVATSK